MDDRLPRLAVQMRRSLRLACSSWALTAATHRSSQQKHSLQMPLMTTRMTVSPHKALGAKLWRCHYRVAAHALCATALPGYDGGDGGGYSDAGSPEPAAAGSCLRGSSPDVSGGATGHESPTSGTAGHEHTTAAGSAAAGSAADGSRSGGLSEQAVQWLLDAGRGSGPVTRGAGWAGASHWRFRAEPDAAAAAKPKAARWE